MADFSNAKIAGKRLATAEVAIEGMTGFRPVLTCRPANESNPKYFNALLKRQRRGRGRMAGELTVETVKKQRKDDRELIPELCVVGWDKSTVIDATDKPVAFSKEACVDLIKALPDEIFDDFRNDIAISSTFLELPDPADIEGQAGN